MDNKPSGSSVQGSSSKRKTSSNTGNDAKKSRTNDQGSSNVSNWDHSKENTHGKGGLVHTLHGVIYQLKLQMLILNRAVKNNYEFSLGTEVEDAEKFDDLVFKYRKNDVTGSYDEVCFVQAKHKQNESREITINELLKTYNSSENEFSLQKYFMSYRKIKQNPAFCNDHLKDFILYTNIGFGNLKSINIVEINDKQNIFQVTKSGRATKRYKLDIKKDHKVYSLLKETSHAYVLANTIIQHLLEKKNLNLKNEIFKDYHIVLSKKIFEITVKKQKNNKGKEVLKRFAKLHKDFVNNHNLSQEVQNFRNVFLSALQSKREKECINNELEISENFGQEPDSPCHIDELPKDTIDDTEIQEFLEKIVFAVDQPNEVELGKLITEEMGQCTQFNLLNANLVGDSFQRKILDWFKHKRSEIGEEGVWLNSQSGRDILDSIDNEVSSLVSVGISTAYPEELARYEIQFSENSVFKAIEEFLSQSDPLKRVLHVVSPEDTLISAINVYSALEILKQTFSEFANNDGFIFVSLDTLLGEKAQKYILNAFQSLDNHRLLIIDCKYAIQTTDHQHQRQIYAIIKLFNKLSAALEKTNKKIILVDKETSILTNQFDEDWISLVMDDTKFSDLTEVSKVNLLRREVIFQGQMVTFNKLIDKSDENIGEIIDTNVIKILIKGEQININALMDLGEIEEYYINRRFKRILLSKLSLKKYLEETKGSSDFFVINGANCGLKHRNVFPYDDIKLAERQFVKLCEQNKETNVHWLETDSKNLAWYRSYGTLTNILTCRLNEEVSSNLKLQIGEAEFVHDENYQKVVVISDLAGMGKSTVLTSLSLELKRSPGNLWISRINLNDYSKLLSETLNNKNVKGNNFLLNKLLTSQISSDLEKQLFENYFSKNGKIVVLLDGFDEICPDYTDIVMELLKSLKKSNVKKIYVTTRPNLKDTLELSLGVFSHVLEPLTKQEQADFLTKFWTKGLGLHYASKKYEDKLNIYVNSIIEHMSRSKYNKDQDYIGIPLQTMMLAETFQENFTELPEKWQGCKEFLDSDLDIPILPNNYTFLDLYKDFVNTKFMKFHLEIKKKRDFTITGERKAAENQYKDLKKKCALLALQTLFSEEVCNKLLTQSQIVELKSLIDEFQSNDHNEGIIDQFIDGKTNFVHRTFAEYFASFLIAEKIISNPADTLKDIDGTFLLNMSSIFINNIIEQLDGKQGIITKSLEIPLLHFVVKEKFANFIRCLLESNFYVWPKKLDACGKTPLHYAVEYRYFDFALNIIAFANDIHEKHILKHGSFKNPDYVNSKLVKFINIQDNETRTALYYAIKYKYTDFAFELLFKGASIDLLSDSDVQVLMIKMLEIRYDRCDIYENGILAAYADQDNKYRPIEEKLLLRAPEVFKELSKKDQSRILSYLFVHGRVNVIDTLLQTLNDCARKIKLLQLDDNGSKPFDRVNYSDHLSDDDRLEITKYLYMNGGYNITNHNFITQILQAAARFGSLKTFKFFIPMEQYDLYYHHLNQACRYNQFSIVQFLLENHKKRIEMNGNTALHSACDTSAPLKLINYFIENKCDVNALNENGVTPLILAINNGELKVIKYLVSKGADVNKKDRAGNTPLSFAFIKNEDKIIKYLLENGASYSGQASELITEKIAFFRHHSNYNVNFIGDNGYPNLHRAIQTSNFEWAQFLVYHGADINMQDVEGKTSLHWATIQQNTEFVEFLLQHGAMFDAKDNDKKTPLDFFADSQSEFKISWIFKLLDTLFKSVNFMQDLHNRLCDDESSENGLVDWGPYWRGHPDVWDPNNPMRFILNAQNSQGKTLLHLAAADTSDTKAIDILLQFNREYLGQTESLSFPRRREYQSISIDKTDYQGNAPLHVAAQKGHDQIVLVLLKEGVIFNSMNLQGETPEVLALNNGHEETVELFKPIKYLFEAIEVNNLLEVLNCIENLRFRSFINVKNEFGKTPLHLAVSLGRVIAVQLLLDNEADLEALDLNKNTPLHIAAQHNETKIVELLLTYGAIFNPSNSQGLRPIDLVPNECHDLRELLAAIDTLFQDIQSDDSTQIINHLQMMTQNGSFDLRTVVNVRDIRTYSLLHYAAKSGEFSVVEYLLENGAWYNVRNKNNQSVINFTNDHDIETLVKAIHNMFENIRDIYQELKVNAKMCKNVSNSARKGLLYYACNSCVYEKVKILVDKGAIVNLTDINYKFEASVDHIKFEMIKYLIDNGNVKTTNYKGETPLIVAIKTGSSLDVIKYLVIKGAEVNQKDVFGNSPLSCARKTDRADIIEYLLTKEADVGDELASLTI